LIIVADLRQKYTLHGVVLQIFSETRLANPLMGSEGLEAGWRIEISRDLQTASHSRQALAQCLNLFPQPWRSAPTGLIEISRGEHSRPLTLSLRVSAATGQCGSR
jgi:hypothetical protein